MMFSQALARAMKETQMSLRKICEGAEVSYEAMKKVKQGKTQSPNFDDGVKIAHFLGLSVDEFIDDQTAVQRTEIVELYSSLKPAEQRFLLTSARGLADDQDHRS